MENLIMQLTSFLPSMVFCVVVWFVVMLIRKLLDYFFPNVRQTRFWKKVVLQSFPVIMGGLLAFIVPMYPFPEYFMNNHVVHTFFGMFLGYISGHVYSAVKYAVQGWAQKLMKQLPIGKGSD